MARTDSIEDSLGPEADEEAFRYVMSLGTRCVTAEFLKSQALRPYAGPFDWVYSSPEMVQHCLSDNFQTFLAKDQIIHAGKGKATGHTKYGPMLNRDVVFPHHDVVTRQDDQEHFKRAAQRLQRILVTNDRKLFLVTHIVKSTKELKNARSASGEGKCGMAAMNHLFKALCDRGVKNFLMMVIYLVESSAMKHSLSPMRLSPKAKLSQEIGVGRERLMLHELLCVGKCTGLYFKNELDQEALAKMAGRGSVLQFDLLEDPLPTSASASSSRVRRGDPTSSEMSAVRRPGRPQARAPPRSTDQAEAPAKANPGDASLGAKRTVPLMFLPPPKRLRGKRPILRSSRSAGELLLPAVLEDQAENEPALVPHPELPEPSALAEPEAPVAPAPAKAEVVAWLREAGFAETEVEGAMARSSTINGCVQWILSIQDQ